MTWFMPARRRPRPKLSHAPADELVRLLADPDSWWRETAQRLLFERQDRSVVESLRTMVKARPTALGRLHALWTLQLLAGLDTESISLRPGGSGAEGSRTSHSLGRGPARHASRNSSRNCCHWPATKIRWSDCNWRSRWARPTPIRA